MSNYRHYITGWNKTAKECYLRGCVCNGCPIHELYFKNTNNCQMKWVVLKLVREFGITDDLKRENFLKDL